MSRILALPSVRIRTDIWRLFGVMDITVSVLFHRSYGRRQFHGWQLSDASSLCELRAL